MRARGDIEYVNLTTGERWQRVSGNGETRLERVDPNYQFNQRTHAEGRAILRVARDLQEFLKDVPIDDPQAASLLRDCEQLERVGKWLANANAVEFGNKITTN